jgi:hypothetical protein
MKGTNPFFDLPINYGIVKKKDQKRGAGKICHI